MSLDVLQQMIPQRVAILGPGLLGASVGHGVRRLWPNATVVAWARSAETRQQAVEVGAATLAVESLQEACEQADFVVAATPVTVIAEHLIAAARVCRPHAVLTDVGSTKQAIVEAVEADPNAALYYVGSHPIAGGDKAGPLHGREDLFRGRLVVLTPTEASDPDRVRWLTSFWQALGAQTISTGPTEHDQILAATSHLPHLVASALASIIPSQAVPFVGPGWRDTTRVAGGSPTMWSAICRENGPAIVEQLGAMVSVLETLRRAVATGDLPAIEAILQRGRENRQRCEA